MAKLSRKLPSNVPGEFYVDSECIDCGACQWLAPENFDEKDDLARVFHQPSKETEIRRSLMSVLACPVAAIGTMERHDYQLAESMFPERIDGPVHYCGYHSPKSYGASSYLITRPQGNILIDSPRFAKPLIDRLEAMGGVSFMVLTHRDDVADHDKFHRHFGCQRLLHESDADPETRKVEVLLEGKEPLLLDDETLLVPVPGHTPGSLCLLYRETYLFTGDHLSWNPVTKALQASRRTCWYDWEEQIRSMERLVGLRFEWVLPGHGWRVRLPEKRMKAELGACLRRMKTA